MRTGGSLREHGVGDDQHEPRAHLGQVHADLARHADAEAHAGNGHLERDVFAHRQPIMDQDAATVSDRRCRTLMQCRPSGLLDTADLKVRTTSAIRQKFAGVISSSGSSADSTRPAIPGRRRQSESRAG